MEQVYAPKRGPLYLASIVSTLIVLFSLCFYNHKKHLPQDGAVCSTAKLLQNGIFVGASPFLLDPLELLRPAREGPGAWPAANPVMLSRSGRNDAGVCQPHLFARNSTLYAFQTYPSGGGHVGQVAVTESNSAGTEWKQLRLQTALYTYSTPYVLSDNEQVYIVLQSSDGAEVALHRAVHYPSVWEYVQTLISADVEVQAVWQHNGTWWMIGAHTTMGGKAVGEKPSSVIEDVFHAPTLQGPWQFHSSHAVTAGMFGRVTVHDNKLLRLGRSCRHGDCKGLAAFEITLDMSGYKQQLLKEINLTRGQQRAAWDGVGHVYVDTIHLPSGQWVAAVTGAREEHAANAAWARLQLWQHLLHVLCFVAALYTVLCLVAAFYTVLYGIQRMSPAQWLSQHKLQVSKTQPSEIAPDVIIMEPSAPVPDAPLAQISITSRDGSLQKRKVQGFCEPPGLAKVALLDNKRVSKRAAWRAITVIPVLIAGLAMVTVSVDTACFSLAPFWQPALPVPLIDASAPYSKFTLMVMSYDKRLESLKYYISHYSQCPSVGEILVVWNKGNPPASQELQAAVPVRVRVEKVNSMNNRYKPDPEIRFRGVLSLDDDIMMPCNDVELGFAVWRGQPQKIVGFYPRLVTQESNGELRYNWEDTTVKEGKYNALLTGAAFLDSRTAFQSYWSDAVAPARQIVDELVNCDDLLMNFVVANNSLSGIGAWPTDQSSDLPSGQQGSGTSDSALEFVRPQRRVDVSYLSGVGLSHDTTKFHMQAEQCLKEFAAIFGGNPLQTRHFDWSVTKAPYCAVTSRAFGCLYT